MTVMKKQRPHLKEYCYLTKEDVQRVNKHKKRYNTSHVVREMQMKTTM